MKDTEPRELPLKELDRHTAERVEVPFSVWDSRMRMAVAGHQDQLLVFGRAAPSYRVSAVPGARVRTHRSNAGLSKTKTPRGDFDRMFLVAKEFSAN